MKLYSKIAFFSLLIIFSTIIISCDKDTDTQQILPLVPKTDIIINLDEANYFDLQTPNVAVLIKENAGKKVGYKGHGIIVIKVFGTYRAWDATSTYDFNYAIEVNGAVGTCPKSNIEYNLLDGVPFEKEQDQTENIKKVSPLQPYFCIKTSTNKLHISDKRY